MTDEDERSKEPTSGLWAVHEGRFHGLAFDASNRHMDHVRWFLELNIPDYGPEFDRILRGRMLWKWDMGYYELTYYGQRNIPNQVYTQVCKFFNKTNQQVVERPAQAGWTM